MLQQNFSVGDISSIGVLILLEALLSADNAMVIAIMVRHLKGEEQKKALKYGLIGAFVLRIIMIVFAGLLIGFWWIQLLGALYLIFLPVNHFIKSHQSTNPANTKKAKVPAGFWKTVILVDLMDAAFALDSVLVAVAVVDTAKHGDKVWVVIAGAIIGMILLRFAAGYFIKLLNRYPVLDHIAYILVGWAGIKMMFAAFHMYESKFEKENHRLPFSFEVPEMTPAVFWAGMLIIIVVAVIQCIKTGPAIGDAEIEQEAEIIEDIEHVPHATFPDELSTEAKIKENNIGGKNK